MNRVDFGGAIFSEATDELVGTTYEDERVRLYFRDKAWEADYKLLQAKFPGKDIGLGSSTADDRIVADHRRERHRPRRALPVRPRRPRSSPSSTRCASGSRASTWPR